MNSKHFNLGLFGKRYNDTNFCLDLFQRGETNISVETTTSLGGIYNILRSNLPSVNIYCFEDDCVEAFIINELLESKRSSILVPRPTKRPPRINYDCIDWLHVAYADDLTHPEILENKDTKRSLDFCTVQPREQYIELIEKSSLVFDSRERKHLYSEILVSTPIILHDEEGCECMINGEVVEKGVTVPEKNINVNGAGDVFAGIFISKYYNSSLSQAIKSTPAATTDHLKGKNEI